MKIMCAPGSHHNGKLTTRYLFQILNYKQY